MQLDSKNTAIVLDSTADFPEAAERFPNWRVVPLYVRFGDESFKDYEELGPLEFYERLRTAPELPTTSQPTPGDFLAAYEGLAGYGRIVSLHISAKLSGTSQSARTAADQLEGDRVRVYDSQTASAATRCWPSQSSAGSTAVRATRRSRSSWSDTRARRVSSSPSTRSST